MNTQTMNKDQALQVIEQALNVSSQKGVFGLQDASLLFTALHVLKQPDDIPQYKEVPQYDLEKPVKMAGSKPKVIKEEK